MIEIWLNPACSKCRSAVGALDAAGAEYVVRRYLDEPPSVDELRDVVGRLGLEPWELARRADAPRLGVTLPPTGPEHREEWLALLSDHPRLVQRPILTASDRTTVIGRDPESVARVVAAG